MAYLDDYSDDERRLQQQSSGPGTSYSPAGGGGASSAPQASSGMTPAPIASYFSANEPAAQGMASGIGTRVEDAGRQAVQDWDAGKAADAWDRAEHLGTQEGIATELHDAYQDPQYTPGMGALDAYVATRASTPGQFDALRSRFAGLDVNEVGEAAPEAPTKRDVGERPGPPKIRDSAFYQNESGDWVPYHRGRAYVRGYDELTDFEAKQNAWNKQNADAQSEYDAANKKYGEDTEAFKKKRQPFLDAFGL